MSIALVGTNGLFTRLGLFGGQLQALFNTQGGNTLTAPAKSAGAAYTDLQAQFTSTSGQSDIFDGYVQNELANIRAAMPAAALIKARCQRLLIRQVMDDLVANPSTRPTIPATLPYAFAELVRQMGSSSLLDSKVSACSVSAVTPTALTGVTNVGTPVVTSSKTGPLLPGTTTGSNAMDLQFIIPETIRVACTADSTTGQAKYSETFTLTGAPTIPGGSLIWNYTTLYGASPGSGSGISITENVCNAASYQGGIGGNLLNNGDFLTFTTHQPNQWTAVAGTAGTDFSDIGASSASVIGGQCLALLHTNVNINLTQQFANTPSGSQNNQVILPNTVYAVNVWLKKDATATGILEIALIDGSANIIQDNNAVNNSFTVDLSTLDTTYTAANGPHWVYFRTPDNLPSNVKIRVRTTTANQVANAYISHLAMKPAKQLYPGGGYVDIFSGATPSSAGDTYLAQFSNNYGGAGTGKTNLQTLCGWLFDLRTIQAPAAGLFIPIVGSTLISDTLIS